MRTFLFLLLLGLSGLTFAQEKESVIRFGLDCDLNIESFSNDDFNNFLINKGYYSSSNILNTMSLGFSVGDPDNHSIIKVKFYSGESLMNNSEEKSTLYSTGFGFDYLYNLINSETWFVGPYIGTRLSNCKFVAVSKNINSTLTTNLIEEIIQFNNSALVDLGIQFNRKVQIYYLDLYLGLNGGYKFGLTSNNWNNSYGEKINDIPDINLKGISGGFNLRIEFNEDRMRDNNN